MVAEGRGERRAGEGGFGGGERRGCEFLIPRGWGLEKGMREALVEEGRKRPWGGIDGVT